MVGSRAPGDDATEFEAHRPALLALAYRMLGEVARAEDVVQEAWVRWQKRQVAVDVPKAFLLTTVTRLCLDELSSARARREQSRGERLPEPVDLTESGLDRVEMVEQISMAFMVILQKLTPAERAVVLLHDVFDMRHDEIGELLGRSETASRQLLRRARLGLRAERQAFEASREEQRALLLTFVRAIRDGEVAPLMDVLAEDAVFVADNPGKGYGKIRSVRRPVVGSPKILALVKALAGQDVPRAEMHERDLNGQPAVVISRNGRVVLAILVAVADGKIRRIFMQADPERLRHVGRLN